MITQLVTQSLLFLLLCFSSLVWSMDEDELDLDDAYGGEQYVSIATGSQQLLKLAPAVTSVVTASEIQKMGATDLNQVLESVPGLHVSVSTTNFNPVFSIRGVHSDINAQVLVLVNGIPITNVFTGHRGQVWGGMPVQNISRVEVIRGPGSAVYGADAFAGVINVITKTHEDIDGLDIGFRGGEFDTREGWLQYSGNFNGVEAAFSFQAGSTQGHKRKIDIDAQNFFDSQFGTTASLAPGSVSVGRQYIDTSLDLSLEDWRLRLWWQGRDNVGTGAGFIQALDPNGSNRSSRFNADLSYENTDWFDHWNLSSQLSFFDVVNQSDFQLAPANSAFPQLDSQSRVIAINSFPNGVLGSPTIYERHYRINASGTYDGFKDHLVKVGVGYRFEDMYKVDDEKNFFQSGNPFPIPLQPGARGRPFIDPHSRSIVFGFFQHEWDLAKDWTLTWGVRYDHYSDFGSTVNPRAALVWQTNYSLTTKLLYGRAFRAPSFGEQFANDETPTLLGNPDLTPETINTLELAFDYQPKENMRAKLNLYRYWYEDIIRPMVDSGPGTPTRTFQNAGNQTGYGLELEGQWAILDSFRFTANYAFQVSEDETTNTNVGFAPTHQVYARADWEFFPDWNWDVQTNWVGDRKRSAMDRRNQVADYFTVDMTLRGEDIFDNLGVSASVSNLFDVDIREPSPPFDNANTSLVPGDFPQAGRFFYFELRYHLK